MDRFDDIARKHKAQALFLVSYRVGEPDAHDVRDELREKLEVELGAVRLDVSEYLVRWSDDPQRLFNTLAGHVGRNDRLYVMEVRGPIFSQNPDPTVKRDLGDHLRVFVR